MLGFETHACVANTLPAELSPQPLFLWLLFLFYLFVFIQLRAFDDVRIEDLGLVPSNPIVTLNHLEL